MKNTKIILIIAAALIVGLGAGYILFGGNDKQMPASSEEHNHEAESMASAGEEIWTCSMHPQIRQNEPGDCPLCGMDLIPLVEGTSDDPLVLQMTNEAVKLANIQTTTVAGNFSSQANKIIPLSGKIQVDERQASSQVAHVPGRIEKLYVTFTGEQVHRGQKIASIYSPELITAQRELLEAIKLADVNPNLLEAARNKLRFWKIGDKAIEAIEANGEIQETFLLLADASGIVTNRRVAVGDHLKEGSPLFDMMNLRKLWVIFDAYEEDLANIKVGNKIEFTTPSIPNKTFITKVTFIDPLINPKTRTVSIRTEINNSNGVLKPEMFVNGNLQNTASPKSNANTPISVPKTAVLWTGKRSVVYVKVPDTNIPSFQFREIELGTSLGDSYQVLSGLEAGEEVVTYGNFTIDAAAQLNNQVSMMNKNVMLKSEAEVDQLPDYVESTPDAFKQQLAKVSDAYLLIKDAFVATNSEQAAGAATQLTKTLETVDMALLKGDAHMYWMEQLNAIEAHSKKIAELNDVEEQRKQFDFLSQALIKSVKVFGTADQTLYVDHCPMANNNNGADWLSREKNISNPYFGDKMLTCGVVKDTITSD